MEKWYNTTGKLRYTDSGWLVLDIDNSIVKYYAYWCQKFIWRKGSFSFHGPHSTVINGKAEDYRKSPRWKIHQGALINFQYSNIIKTDDHYYWLSVKSERLKEIRQELGASPYPKWEYHITCLYVD